jgi:hypothetical protein
MGNFRNEPDMQAVAKSVLRGKNMRGNVEKLKCKFI